MAHTLLVPGPDEERLVSNLDEERLVPDKLPLILSAETNESFNSKENHLQG